MIRIGVISDTHGLLRLKAEEMLAGAEHIIHAGDIGDAEIVPRLRRIAPTTAIRGNIDSKDWAREFPEQAVIALGSRTLYVLHDVKQLDIDPVAAGYNAVIAGHSHRPKVETIDGVLHLNPGSAGRRRFRLPITLATLVLGDDLMEARIHTIEA